jgi:hypothetical protein
VAAGADALLELTSGLNELKDSILDAQKVGLSKRALDNLVELAVLRGFSMLEGFFERLFYLCMLSDNSVSGNGPVLPLRDKADAELLLLSSRDKREPYLDWLPYDRTLALAELYLLPGSPFEWLKFRSVEVSALSELTILRNEVAHGSDQARARFLALSASKSYKATRAADYLLSVRGGDLEILLILTQVGVIASALVAAEEIAAAALLQPERVFQSETLAPAGRYTCTRCGQGQILGSRSKLRRCPACDVPTPCPSCGRVDKTSSAWERLLQADRPMSPADLAQSLGVDARRVRTFLRTRYGPLGRANGSRWLLSRAQIAAVRARFQPA